MKRDYVVALQVSLGKKDSKIEPLYTGKLYTAEEARKKVEYLNKYCKKELDLLRYDQYIVYNATTEA